ncbi:MAG: ribonuclease Y [Gemmataceae bacterium]|nr:ribonuclease Y [Gemmataceae bacterium]
MEIVWGLVGSAIGLIAGVAICFVWLRRVENQNHLNAEARSKEIISQAERNSENILKESELKAKDEFFKRREELNRDLEQSRNQQRDQERRLDKKEGLLEQQNEILLKKEKNNQHTEKKLHERKEHLDKKIQDTEKLAEDQARKLHDITGMSRDEAEKTLLDRLGHELADEVASRIQKHEEAIKLVSEEKARRIIATSIHRYAADHTADTTVSTVDIPSDDMKGRIIGREGRNIRTFEKATGVDVIVDDTPGVVIVSAFDNVRREIARISLGKLIQDGRIHPSRIEEVVKETAEEMDRNIIEIGKAAVMEANVGHLHEKLVHLLGRLKFRTSYSQNVLNHSLEVAYLTGMLADEIGLDGRLARRCGLLHDIGKAADHEMEGGHPKIGAELAKRYGETSKEVLHAIIGHHDDVTVDHIYTVLVAAADAISAARPGARRETLEKYVKRLEELEALAQGFPGVEHAFAIQAGRELRVIANAHTLSDSEALKTCREIAKSIEQQLNYPGEIKVTVVRETRSVEFAR